MRTEDLQITAMDNGYLVKVAGRANFDYAVPLRELADKLSPGCWLQFDMEYCEKLFDAWCWGSEPNGYFQYMFEMEKPENGWDFSSNHLQMMPFRNLLSCESHHDILRNCMLMLEEKRTGGSGGYGDVIREFRYPAWLELPEKGR